MTPQEWADRILVYLKSHDGYGGVSGIVREAMLEAEAKASAEEREACAKIAEAQTEEVYKDEYPEDSYFAHGYWEAMAVIANKIRERGNHAAQQSRGLDRDPAEREVPGGLQQRHQDGDGGG